MPTEPSVPTLSDVVRRAAEVTDPGNELVEDLQQRTEDADEPVTAIEDVDERIAEEAGALDPEGDDPVLAMTAALGRMEEFELHAKASPNAGVTDEELDELLFQIAGYAGGPAAVASRRILTGIRAERDADPS